MFGARASQRPLCHALPAIVGTGTAGFRLSLWGRGRRPGGRRGMEPSGKRVGGPSQTGDEQITG